MAGKLYRQGDVLLRRTHSKAKGKPVARDDRGRIVLAEGEVTGHAHAIADREAELLHDADTERRFLEVLAEGGVDLLHEEHRTMTLPKGTYEVVIQREYAPEAPRNVVD
jgi:hypothetical protein